MWHDQNPLTPQAINNEGSLRKKQTKPKYDKHTESPMLRKSPPSLPDSLSRPISTIHSDSGMAGNACILSGCRQSCGSRDITRTVLSLRPMARNLERCSPEGTVPRAMHCTSEDISFRSVYSFSWPDWKRETANIKW